MFAKKYDLPPGWSGQDIMLQYMNRKMILGSVARQGFKKGQSVGEVKCLETLRDIILGAFSFQTT